MALADTDDLFNSPIQPNADSGAKSVPAKSDDDNTAARFSGEIVNVLFASDDDNFTVARLRNSQGVDVTVVGAFGGAFVGQGLEVAGTWETHPDYGRQLRAETVKFILPVTAEGVERYLASGLIKGVGPKRAKMIVQRFGADAINVLDNYSARLREIPGFGKKTVERIREAWRVSAEQREIRLYFQSLGISSAYARRVVDTFGARALGVVKNDPYLLAEKVNGIGFAKADSVARNLGINERDPRRARAGVGYALTRLASAGHSCYPSDALVEHAAALLELDATLIQSARDDAIRRGTVQQETLAPWPGVPPTPMAYLPDLYGAEKELAAALYLLAKAPYCHGNKFTDRTLSVDVSFNEEQAQAVDNVRRYPVTVITGGPGVGKTTVVSEIVKRAQAASVSVALAAPTGRAAKRLSESTGRSAATIHRLLKWEPKRKGFAFNQDNPLAFELIVVDEVSMLDIDLARRLFQAIKSGTSVVLVGDVDQLPSVGPGDFLRHLIHSGLCPVTRLTQVYRQKSGGRLIRSAHTVNQGLVPELRPDSRGALSDFYWIDREDPQDAADTMVTLIKERIPRRFGFDPVDDIQALCPMNRNACGAIALNAAIQTALNPHGAKAFDWGGAVFKVGDKVMQTTNNYDKNAFNGDVGRLIAVDREAKTFTVKFDNDLVEYDFNDADQLRLAYAVTIHKSQGCEFPVVVAPFLMSHYMMLRRDLLYTAMTRAKRLLVIVGSRKALAMAVRNVNVEPRYSGLWARLRQFL